MNSNAGKEEVQRLVMLSNRYGASNYLRKIGDNTYKYEGETDFIRVGFKGEKEEDGYQFIDPSGGPFLSIGSEIFGIEGKLSEIKIEDNEFILKFE